MRTVSRMTASLAGPVMRAMRPVTRDHVLGVASLHSEGGACNNASSNAGIVPGVEVLSRV
jgi:hypothetical protein